MADILAAFAHRQPSGEGWTARCPAHDDARNSLAIGRGDDGRWLLKCHAGCTVDAILTAAKLNLADLYPSKNGTPTYTFDYHDEQGTLLYQVVRFPPKDFRQRAADGSWSLKGIRRVLYRLPELKGRRTVFVVEGEKDADRLWSLGLAATTNAGGAGKWRAEYAPMLVRAGCQRVVVLPDNDAPGETHGRDVARACVDAQLQVKLIALPDLPRKGDVSDYLQRHSKTDLLAIVAEAPPFNSHLPVATPQPLALTSLADFLDEPDDMVEWIVQDRIASGSVVLFVAPPKAGKSTAARELACAVSRGEPWLGWATTPGPVWLLVFEDKRSEVRKHFRRMGVDARDPVRFFIDQAPVDLLPQLHALAAKEQPALIIVDTLARALKVKDFNDYAMVTTAFEPLLKLTRDTGASLLLLYHSSVHVAREGLDAVLGSTALSGSVDNILILKRTDQQRVLSSVQRIGADLEPTVIALNPTTGRLERVGSKREQDDAEIARRILAALAGLPEGAEPMLEKWIQEHVDGKNADKVRVLRQLLGTGQVGRVGKGGKHDPFRYFLDLGNLRNKRNNRNMSVDGSCSRDFENAEFADFAGTTKPQINTGLFDASPVLVPDVPSICQEQGNKRDVRTSGGSSSNHVSQVLVPEVPLVPDPSENSQNGEPKTTETPDKHASDSCSRDCEPDDERFL